jgi:hypothetical protein
VKKPYRKWVWHGLGGKKAYDAVCNGRGLELPTKYTQVVDVGDWGNGVYFTTSRFRAHLYARDIATPKGRRYPLVYARVHLENPVYFDFSAGAMFDPDNPSTKLLMKLEKRWGSSVRGHDMDERERAAHRWRHGLIAMGHDGVVVRGGQDTEVVVYKPRKSIMVFKCFLGRPRGE